MSTLNNQEKMLIVPLYAKAKESRKEHPILLDRKADEIFQAVTAEEGVLPIPEKTNVTLLIRAKQLDVFTEKFLGEHPDAVVIHLGCGLDSRCERVGQTCPHWYDLDLPEVIDIRRKFYRESDTYHMIASSAADLKWLDRIAFDNSAVLCIAEGLVMYLSEDDVRALIMALTEKSDRLDLIFDAYSTLAVQQAGRHPSLKASGAVIRWGIDNPGQIEQWVSGLQLQEEWFFSQSPAIRDLSFGYRLMFQLAGRIKSARRAHRILYYTKQ
ncbi:MAG: class I SAM-dependent methyltransferase [Spirochaetales bacterium]|nr:class I SAM-dependent methyltransferase [Spirochaetales bacterium]